MPNCVARTLMILATVVVLPQTPAQSQRGAAAAASASAIAAASDEIAKFGIAMLKIYPKEGAPPVVVTRVDLAGPNAEPLGAYREERRAAPVETISSTLTWKGRVVKLVGSDKAADLWEGEKHVFTVVPLQPPDAQTIQALESYKEFLDLMKALSTQLKQATQTPSVRPFNVAIVQANGGAAHLEPIARFTGTAWVNTWPSPGDAADPVPALDKIPDAWLGRPLPREWIVWSAGGQTRVRVTGTRRGDACEALVQLTLDEAPAKGQSEPRVAVDTDQVVGGIRAVTRTDAEWAQLAPVITAAFRANEGRAGDESPRLKAQVTPEKLAGLPMSIDYVVRPDSSSIALLYYFEATKRPPARATRDQMGVAVSGWIRRDAAGGWIAVDVTARTLGSDANPVPSHVPLATFRLSGRDFWLVEFRGYEGSAASIIEISASAIQQLIEVLRAGC